MRFEQAEEGMQYVLPPRRNAASIIGVGLWLAFVAVWGVREFEKTSGRDPFLLPWAVFVPVVLFAWLRHVAGRELVTLALAALKIRRHVFGVGLTREYDVSQIRNLRVAPPVPTWRDPKRNWTAFDHGMIAFEYGAKTVRFGAGVNQAKAATIVDEIKRHYGLL